MFSFDVCEKMRKSPNYMTEIISFLLFEKGNYSVQSDPHFDINLNYEILAFNNIWLC